MTRTLVYPFDVTIPAGTPIATPVTVLTQFEANTVDRIEWNFPPGCQGLVGIQIGSRSVPVIPSNRSQWLIRSGEGSGIAVTELHNTGDWSVIGYNTGAFDHAIHVVFHVHRNVRVRTDTFIIDGAAMAFQIGES